MMRFGLRNAKCADQGLEMDYVQFQFRREFSRGYYLARAKHTSFFNNKTGKFDFCAPCRSNPDR